MDWEGQKFDAWAIKILDLPHQINTMLPRSRQFLFYNHSVILKFLVNSIAQYVEVWWMDQFRKETQSESAMEIGKELLGVLNRGLQLLQPCVKEDFAKEDFAVFVSMIYGSTGEFYEIIDDVKMYCQMMNKLIERKVKSSLIYDIQKLQDIVQLNCSMLQDRLTSSCRKDKNALFATMKDDSLISVIQSWDGQRKSINISIMQEPILGKGSFGVVKKALWLDVLVAIKEYKSESHFQEEYNVYVKLEAKNCSHIVQVYGYSVVDGGKKALVMELMDMDLKKLIEKKKKTNPNNSPFSVCESIDIMLQIAKGITYLHEVGLIHRDIRTSNILVKTRGDKSLIVKIASFCSSKAHFQSGVHLGSMGSSVYTYKAESSKESRDFCAEYTKREDVFRFGMVCTEIFGGSILAETFIRFLPKDICEPLVQMIIRCQGKNNRPSFGEICHRLWELKEMVLINGNVKMSQKYIAEDMVKTNVEIIQKYFASQKRIAESDLSIEAVAGIGSYATIHRAFWLGKAVAVKEFAFDGHFAEEYEIFMKLQAADCSHIVQFLGHSELRGRKVIVMELMDMDLNALLKRKENKRKASLDPPFSLEESIDIMLQIAKGVRSLHEINVIHRDIKPSNILIKAREDGSLHVKLAGFCSSKADFETENSNTGLRGTQVYMAPEMKSRITEMRDPWMSSIRYSRKVDVYSFGLVCIEILTGRQTDPRKPMVEDFKKSRMPSLNDEGIRESLHNIICQCLQPEGDKRPSFEEICNSLEFRGLEKKGGQNIDGIGSYIDEEKKDRNKKYEDRRPTLEEIYDTLEEIYDKE